MSELFERFKAWIENRLRGPAFSRLLRHFGIDPKRYWLLMDLFHRLSTREEMQSQLGRHSRALRFSAIICAGMSLITGLGSLLIGARAWSLAGLSLGLTAFTLVAVLMSEAANSLVNPDEALALAHQPINGATYTGAKLSHLLNIVLHYVLGWNLFPALILPFLSEGSWFHPVLHLLAALTLGLVLALFCCSIFGLLMRAVPARRMKSAAQFIQAIPAVIIGFFQFSPRGTAKSVFIFVATALSPLAVIPLWLFAAVGTVVAATVTIVGIRSLSGDYLIRVSSIVHGKANARTSIRRSYLGEIVRRFFGGQVGRAGFDYMKRMMLRDWQFRRQLLGLLPMVFFAVVGIVGAGLRSPFAADFSSAHLMPHAIGIALYMICRLLPYGTDYKGVWLFLLASDRALARFARGIHASLLLVFIIVPSSLLLPLLIWRWGAAEALTFILYSATVASVYLALALRKIEGVPFGKQIGPNQMQGSQAALPILIFSFCVILAVGLQYLLYRSMLAVWIATIIFSGVALLLTRRSLKTLHTAIVYHLGMSTQTSTMIYKEVETD